MREPPKSLDPVQDQDENSPLARIRRRNRRTRRQVGQFREEFDPHTADRDFLKVKYRHPFFGFVPCRAGEIDFVLFHANDDMVAWEYLWFGPGCYEPEITATWTEWCATPQVVYDIGAYTGLMSIIAALTNDETTVHLFEPLDRTMERATINLRANRVASQVTRHTKAASDVNGEARINLYRDEDFLGTGNSLYDKGLVVLASKIIETVILDEYLPDARPTIIKLDVEGHELAALRGMEQTVLRSRPKMVVEVWEHTRDDVLALLESWGYDARPVDDPTRRVANYIALPRGA